MNPVVSDKCACTQHIVGWTLSRDLHSIFGRRGGCAFFLLKYNMAESQLKSTKRASGCGHPLMIGTPIFSVTLVGTKARDRMYALHRRGLFQLLAVHL